MGHPELLTALRRKGEEHARERRGECRRSVEELRAATAEKIALLNEAAAAERSAACAERRRQIVAETAHQASLVRQRAEHGLARRLEELAGRSLPRLRDDRYPALLARLASELPPGKWGRVRVNPADAEVVGARFPGSEIVVDPEICGGLVALSRDGSLTVVNTLASRLAKGWPDLLPLLMAEVRGAES